MIKTLLVSYKYKYDNLSDNSRKIANLGILLLLLLSISMYIISLHSDYIKNIANINNLMQKKATVEQLVKTIPPKLNATEVEQSLKQSNIQVISIKWENNLELDLETELATFLTWLQSTRFKIKDINIQKKENSNKLHITAVLI
ncbi:MAG: hypothetical protein RLZZ210_426 [Pseudomonadota bacterium]|jgi:hypothetical protein